MIILTTSTSLQEFKFIPRVFSADKLTVRDEQTNVSVDFISVFTQDGYYLKSDISFSLNEGRYYEVTVFNSTDIVYKDKIFCTDQTIEGYSINNGIYNTHTSNNDYIVI